MKDLIQQLLDFTRKREPIIGLCRQIHKMYDAGLITIVQKEQLRYWLLENRPKQGEKFFCDFATNSSWFWPIGKNG